ncbi:hypothetical protein ACIQGZ_12380 [Streptomyces sp. NPDC092296]|uniref:hypothetical protein n=1 Tax=Streptomyces sp. NPDC092296 TaxID=3366012 RepID=UPI00381B2CD6
MRFLRTFLPWIAFAVIATKGDWRYGATAALLIAAWLLAGDFRAGRGANQLVMELSGALFFAAVTAFSWIAPHSALNPYGPALSLGWLAVTAWGSLALRRPFTLGIARTMTPPEVWQRPEFHRANVVIATVWALSFTVTAGALAVLLAGYPHATAAVIAVKVLGFAVPISHTLRASRAGAARAAARSAAAQPTAAPADSAR